jgi:type IV secretory pathway TrbD component
MQAGMRAGPAVVFIVGFWLIRIMGLKVYQLPVSVKEKGAEHDPGSHSVKITGALTYL